MFIEIQNGINQHLKTGYGDVPIPCQQANTGGKRTSGAVSADGYPIRADAELRRILQHPAISGETVFQTDGKCVFRQQPIIHGNDFAWRIQCIAAGQLFVTGG